MSEKIKAVETMISKVMKKKDLSRAAAIDYMLVVATGRLAALWRYETTLPEGKPTKGILTLVGRKKRADKTPRIALPTDARLAPKRPAPKRPAPKRKRASKAVQMEIVAAAS